jgi:hypothetical protein
MAPKRTETKSSKAPAARKPALRRKRTLTITHDDIATRAYYLHLEGGYDPHENWIRAERELAGA